MSESNIIVRDVRQYAVYETSAGSSAAATPNVAPQEAPLNLDELSARDLEAYVNAGELTAEQVYEHELKSPKPRKTVLQKYAPAVEVEESSSEDDAK